MIGARAREAAGAASRGVSPEARELFCAECGYGVVVRDAAPACPMCRATAWRARPRREHHRIYRQEHRSAGVGELAERTHIDVAQAEALVAADARVRSLSEAVDGIDGEVGTLGDLLEDPLSAAAYEDVIDAVPASSCGRSSRA